MYKYILIIIRIHELLGDEGPQIFKFGIFVQKWLNCPKKIFVFGSEEIRDPRFFTKNDFWGRIAQKGWSDMVPKRSDENVVVLTHIL